MEASKLYKEPSTDRSQPPHHRYTLRGVRTLPHVLYVLQKTVAGDDHDMLGSAIPEYDWWKIVYDASSLMPVQTSMLTEEEVLVAAGTESKTALLVYASDRAVSYESHPLPPQLEKFVRADNLAFQSELDNHSIQNPENDFELPSVQKRKAAVDDDSDLEVEYDRSPRARSNGDAASSNESSPLGTGLDTDDDDGDIGYAPAPPPPGPRLRPLEPKPRVTGSTDDSIPVTLQQEQEMQESERGREILRNFYRKSQREGGTQDMDIGDDDEGYGGEQAHEKLTKR